MAITRCPRCQSDNPPKARFCGRCGLNLDASAAGPNAAALARHPHPLTVPHPGAVLVAGSVGLWYWWESGWGGTHWGAESIAVHIFNCGYGLRALILRIEGRSADGTTALDVEHIQAELAHGELTRIEIPAFEMKVPIRDLSVSAVSADYGPQ